MDRNVPHDEIEEKMLQQFRHIYGNDVLRFKFTGAEVVELMAMGYHMGITAGARMVKEVVMMGMGPKENK